MINIEEFWNNAKDELSISIQPVTYEVWIEKLEPVCFTNNALVLCAPTASAKKIVNDRYKDLILDSVKKLNSNITDTIIITSEKKSQYLANQSGFISGEGFVVSSNDKEKPIKKQKSQFLDKYTFNNFIEGKSNAYALAACKTVAENVGSRYNPLFIYAGVGLGKTHLLHAIGNYLEANDKQLKIVYTNSENFVTELISVIRSKSNDDNNKFREKYRSCDVLMIDDIQFLINKEATQEALFHIFNDLYNDNKQIIFTSDKAPKDLEKLEDRLRTRFEWGLTVDIQVPDVETRIAIIKNKAEQANFILSDEVAEFIADNSTSNIREMEGLLNKIIFYSSLVNKPITTKEGAADVLGGFIEDKKDTIDASSIIDAVCNYFNVSTADLISKKRTKNIVEPRMIAIYLILDFLGLTLDQIGELFGGRDHTTIIHSREKITEELKTNKRIKIAVSNIKNYLLHK